MVTTDILLPTCNRLASLVMTLSGVAAQSVGDHSSFNFRERLCKRPGTGTRQI